MQEQPQEHMLLKWRQHHFVRFLTLTGNPFPVPLGLLQVLKQTEIFAAYKAAMDEVARKFLAGDSHYHHSLSRGKKAVQPSDSSTPCVQVLGQHIKKTSLAIWKFVYTTNTGTIGPGQVTEEKIHHRGRINVTHVDHFVEFINRPYFSQDVSYGTKFLNLGRYLNHRDTERGAYREAVCDDQPVNTILSGGEV